MLLQQQLNTAEQIFQPSQDCFSSKKPILVAQGEFWLVGQRTVPAELPKDFLGGARNVHPVAPAWPSCPSGNEG